MAFNIFKKKPFDKTQGKQEEIKKAPAREAEKAVAKTASVPAKKSKRSIASSALSLPHITEKAALLGAQNQYVFKTVPGATKHGVKESVEAQYGVEVKKVRVITVPSKSIRVGKRMGEKQGYKKAVVTLKEGHKIEIGA